MKSDAVIYGLLYAVLVGHFFTKPVVSSMWDYLALKHKGLAEGEGRYSSQPAILGIVERSLYFVSLLFNASPFIGVWLTLKTVAKSPRWSNERDGLFREALYLAAGKRTRKLKHLPGRALFQPFLVGNGLSILYGGAGYAIAMLLSDLDHFGEGLAAGCDFRSNSNINFRIHFFFDSANKGECLYLESLCQAPEWT